MSSTQIEGHKWRFFRSGGFDQVALSSGDDLRNLAQLDPKLWTVLNCPTTGLEFDGRTAALLDSDGDGQTNGFELGDPCCVWTANATPAFTTDISHPGIPSSTTQRAAPACMATACPKAQ